MTNWTHEHLATQLASNPDIGIVTEATAVHPANRATVIVSGIVEDDTAARQTNQDARSEFLALLGANVPITNETDMQATIFACTHALIPDYPELATYYAIPNQHSPGRRPVAGQRAGMPDTCLPVSRGDGITTYHALYIELKMPGKYPRPEQRAIHELLRAQGNAVEVCKSVTSTVDLLRAYLDGTYAPF